MTREDIKIWHGNCLNLMNNIPDKSVNCIICDLPYGTTASKWDNKLPLDELWVQYNRILTDNGVVCLFGSEPFSSYLRMSNIKHFKYDWIWEKNSVTGFVHAKNMPLKNYEIISIFSNAGMGHKSQLGDKRMIYNPQGIIKVDKISKTYANKFGNIIGKRPSQKEYFLTEYTNYPKMILNFNKEHGIFHPTAKPVALLEYLIKTYSFEGDMILDNCAGSMSTAIAAINTNRKCICIELDDKYYNLGLERVNNHFNDIK